MKLRFRVEKCRLTPILTNVAMARFIRIEKPGLTAVEAEQEKFASGVKS
jgi:hypothetical protein